MISVIVCSVDDLRLKALQQNLVAAMGQGSLGIGPHPRPAPMAEGDQRGIAASKGDALILCHDDVEILSPDLPWRLREHLARFDLIGVAGTSRLCSGYWLEAGPPYLFGQVIHLRDDNTFNVDVYGAVAGGGQHPGVGRPVDGGTAAAVRAHSLRCRLF